MFTIDQLEVYWLPKQESSSRLNSYLALNFYLDGSSFTFVDDTPLFNPAVSGDSPEPDSCSQRPIKGSETFKFRLTKSGSVGSFDTFKDVSSNYSESIYLLGIHQNEIRNSSVGKISQIPLKTPKKSFLASTHP